LEGEVVLKGSLFLKGHAFKSCGNFRKISRGFHRLQKQLGLLSFRGRAALQGRVKHMESIRASAPVVVFSALTDFFRSLLERLTHTIKTYSANSPVPALRHTDFGIDPVNLL